jgi:DNA-binding transcriptional ArsR family regulator
MLKKNLSPYPEYSLLSAFFGEVVAHPCRPYVIEILHIQKELNLKELNEIITIPDSTLSRHVNHLARRGILKMRVEGTYSYYSLGDIPEYWIEFLLKFKELHELNLNEIELMEEIHMENENISENQAHTPIYIRRNNAKLQINKARTFWPTIINTLVLTKKGIIGLPHSENGGYPHNMTENRYKTTHSKNNSS